MIKKRSSVMFVTIGMLGMILFSGCGAGTGGDDPAAPPPGQTVAASIDLLVSNPQLDSDVAGAPTVTLTAIVKDSSNRALIGERGLLHRRFRCCWRSPAGRPTPTERRRRPWAPAEIRQTG